MMLRKLGKYSHETFSLRRGGIIELRKLRRRLVIWHTTQLEILQDDGARSHETLLLIRAGLQWRKLGRRLVIWHTTQLEILQDDGAKTCPEFS
jgi:hypothetical protein